MSKLVKKQTHMLQNGDVIYFVYRKSEPEQSELLLDFEINVNENLRLDRLCFPPQTWPMCTTPSEASSRSARTVMVSRRLIPSHVVLVPPGSCCGLCLCRRRAQHGPQSGLRLASRGTALCGAPDPHKGTAWDQPGGPSALHLKFPLLHREHGRPRPSRSR